TIIINKPASGENSGEITDETSRTTRSEEDDPAQDISDPGEEMDKSSSHHKRNGQKKHIRKNGFHNNRGRKMNGDSSDHNSNQAVVTNIVSNVPNDDLDNVSTQSPFSVPTVDLFPVDSAHSILTYDDFNTSGHTLSKRSTNSLALSPSVSQRGAVSMPVTAKNASTPLAPVTASPPRATVSDSNAAAARRKASANPTLRPVERTNSFIQRRNKRLDQIKKRVMSKKQQRLMQEQQQNHHKLDQVQEEYDEEDNESTDFYEDEAKSPSHSSRRNQTVVAATSPKGMANSPTATSATSPVTSSGGSSSTPRRCLSADRGRKESRGITIRDNSPLSTRSETRASSSKKIRVEHRRSSERSNSRSDRKERRSRLSGSKSPTKPRKESLMNVAVGVPQVPQSPGSQRSQSSSQYRSHRQEEDHYDHLEEELTMANLIISQQQEQIKSLQDTNEKWKTRFEHAQEQHEMQLETTLQSLYQAQKKQDKTEQDLQLALAKINSLNELHEAVAKIQQLTGLQLLGTAPSGDDTSIKSDGTKSVKSAPSLVTPRPKTKNDLLPLAEDVQSSYISDTSGSDASEFEKELTELSDSKCVAPDEESRNIQPVAQARRYSGSHIPEKSHSQKSKGSSSSKQKSKSTPSSLKPVVPSRQDQSQASFLDSALSRKHGDSSNRRYSLQR
ncbi:MAG: hypothetical protein SGILL_005830, partial [Bacillariaceae sp.]